MSKLRGSWQLVCPASAGQTCNLGTLKSVESWKNVKSARQVEATNKRGVFNIKPLIQPKTVKIISNDQLERVN